MVRIVYLRSATGEINDSDVDLAAASKAVLLGFNLKQSNVKVLEAEERRVQVGREKLIA